MTKGLRALLQGVLDDAALFPPAELPLEQAVRNDTQYRRGPDGWLLGRFVCPAARLPELGPLLPDAITPLSVVLRSADDVPSVREFAASERGRERARIESLEIPLPAELVSKAERGALEKWLDRMRDVTIRAGLAEIMVFCEANTGSPRDPRIDAAVIEALSSGERPPRWAFKLRTGGQSVPSPAEVAFVLALCRDLSLPWKATAGLHHPMTQQRDGHYEFGFLNLFAAAVLANVHGLSIETITTILTEPDALRFDDDGLAWGDLRADIDAIRTTRRSALMSFGSCSFVEPRNDLRLLGLL